MLLEQNLWQPPFYAGLMFKAVGLAVMITLAVKTLTKRILALGILAAVITICSELWRATTPNVTPPPSAAEWKLSAPADCGKAVKAEFQAWPETSKARQACRARYSGPWEVRLTLFDMPEQPGATAFGAFQSWITSGERPGKRGFLKGRYFGVVESSNSDRAAMDRFIGAIERALP